MSAAHLGVRLRRIQQFFASISGKLDKVESMQWKSKRL
jgi:hypothetical protein